MSTFAPQTPGAERGAAEPAEKELCASSARTRSLDLLLLGLLLACILRLWVMPLPSSFWVDEAATAFVVHHGASHPSLAVAPQVPASIYYALPRAMEALGGFSEITYRLPSLIAMALALFFIMRLAGRLIDPRAAWFVAFACLALRGFSYQAADARPYALGTFVAAASLWALVRWLDSARWRDALLFVAFAALLWRVHLIYWPFYLLLVAYVFARLAARDTAIRWPYALLVFGVIALTLAPVAIGALALLRQAKAHVTVDPPSFSELGNSLKLGLIITCCCGAALISRWRHWSPDATRSPSMSGLVLILGWWLCQPLALFVFSWATGDSVFLSRYLFIALPGAAFAAAAAAAIFIRPAYWRPLAAVLGLGVLLVLGQWNKVWPPHHNSDWRGATQRIAALSRGREMPVVCPSPFVEAQPPAWHPDYPLPSFLYSHLDVYRLPGRTFLFPFKTSDAAEEYATTVTRDTLSHLSCFAIYGGDENVRFWRTWFARQRELAGWNYPALEKFGDVNIAVFEKLPQKQ